MPNESPGSADARSSRIGQTTYVGTWTGFVYVAFIVDVYAPQIVAGHVATTMSTQPVLDALERAIWTRANAAAPAFSPSTRPTCCLPTSSTADVVDQRRDGLPLTVRLPTRRTPDPAAQDQAGHVRRVGSTHQSAIRHGRDDRNRDRRQPPKDSPVKHQRTGSSPGPKLLPPGPGSPLHRLPGPPLRGHLKPARPASTKPLTQKS